MTPSNFITGLVYISCTLAGAVLIVAAYGVTV